MKIWHTRRLNSSCRKSSCMACSFFFFFLRKIYRPYFFCFGISCGCLSERVFSAHRTPGRDAGRAVRNTRYVRGPSGLRHAGPQYKLSPGRIKTHSQPRINTDSLSGALDLREEREICSVLFQWVLAAIESAVWKSDVYLTIRMPELRLIKGGMSSSYAALTPFASPLQPENNQGYLRINPEHLATFVAAWEEGKEMQIPHELVCVPVTLQKI